ncbi:YfdQ family protein [Streptosporangium sp. NBC_01755]|uniref:DUF2303 family protein n=1 Tax=Streptosporangium sp. NBC_01755 TaxID=2975949 RepID=UPI002DD8F412|nr:DUF2303 family protein [Streptosporangium sp. NBC_01755]WSC98434.1 YfdQ family protein [Streptosporangium sp. NBC_01755]
MNDRTENDALIEALNTSYIAEQLEPGGFYAYKHNDHVTTIDLLDKHLERPRRKTGRVVVEDVPSFVHYYKKHADSGSEVFVDVEAGRITAILDAHEPTPDEDLNRDESARWGEHQLVLVLHQTDAWKRWGGKDRQLIRQAEFADFIDDNRADIRKPTAAEMLELVQHFQTQKKVTFNSAIVLSNGDRRLTFTEETDAGAGTKGQIEVPSVLELGIAPFEDSEPYVVSARFRYRIQNSALYMGVLLDNADDVLKDAVKTVVTKIQEELGVQIMRGTPA